MTAALKTRSKKVIPGMLPVKEWLTIEEATAYTTLCRNTFLKYVAPHVSIAMCGPKEVYKVDHINKLIEQNIFIKK